MDGGAGGGGAQALGGVNGGGVRLGRAERPVETLAVWLGEVEERGRSVKGLEGEPSERGWDGLWTSVAWEVGGGMVCRGSVCG